MTDETFDMATIAGCLGWALCQNPPGRRRLEAELARLRAAEAALERLARVGGEFSCHMAGPHWEELCGALSQARDALARA